MPLTSDINDYTVESQRLRSFEGKWAASHPISPKDLAEAGLYFTGAGDRVKCAFCYREIYDWEAGDIPIETHQNHFPTCPFVISIDLYIHDMNWQVKNSDAAKIVMRMGYSEDIIRKALGIIYENPPDKLTCEILLDEISKLEEELELEGCTGNSQSSSSVQRNQVMSLPNVMLEEAVRGMISIGKAVNRALLLPALRYQHQVITATILIPQKRLQETYQHKLLQLESAKEEVEKKTQCKVCLVAEIKLLFLPCRHLVCCKDCGPRLTKCALCRTVIVEFLDVYI